MEQHENAIFETSGLDESAKAHLLETTRWTKFIAIMGIVGSVFIILGGVSVMYYTSFQTNMDGGYGVGMGLFYVVLAAVYIYPSICLVKFSRAIKLGVQTSNSEMISNGFRHQKNMYRFIGISIIISIAFALIMFIYAVSSRLMNDL